jgi:dipeptidase E
VKLLLTSGGVSNATIQAALRDLLGKPVEQSAALFVPTAIYAFPGSAEIAYKMITGQMPTPLCELGWKSLGVLELTALPSIDRDLWVSEVQQTDVLLVGGGDALYLAHWMRESGLAELLPTLNDLVYVGVSGGSMVMSPAIGEEFMSWQPPGGVDSALGVVDFAIFPHVDHPAIPYNSMAAAELWASKLSVPGYALDDDTAIKVTDGAVDVISEGHWRLFE